MRRWRLVPALLGASACMSPVSLRYTPQGVPTTFEAAGAPRVYLASVEDRTGGVRFDGPVAGKTAGSMGDALREALVTEFRRVGLPLAESRTGADAALYASLTEAVVTWGGGYGVTMKALVRVALKLKSADRSDIWDGELSGRGQAKAAGGAAVGGSANIAVNQAFAEAVGRLGAVLTEEGVVDLIRARASGAPSVARPAAQPARPAVRSDLDELPKARPSRPNAHALVIGIENYREQLPRAEFAGRDALLAAEYFKRVLGVPQENLAVLVDGKATRSDFEKYIESWLQNRVEPGDEVYVYFSGHGAPDPAKGASYLVPFDGDPAYLEQTAYPLKRLYEQLGRLKAKRVFVALDSCFSGSGGRSVLAKGARPLVTTVEEETPASVTVLSAASGAQISNTFMEKGNGLFTYYFLRGLKELGPDLEAVYGYLRPEVARAARRDYNADQEPQWREGR